MCLDTRVDNHLLDDQNVVVFERRSPVPSTLLCLSFSGSSSLCKVKVYLKEFPNFKPRFCLAVVTHITFNLLHACMHACSRGEKAAALSSAP